MMRSLLLSLLLSLSAFGASLEWEDSLDDVIDAPAMVMIETAYCPWCKRMKFTTLRDEKVVKELAPFTAVRMYKSDWNRLQIDHVKMVPTVYFLDHNKKIIKKVVGFWEASDFLTDIKDVKEQLSLR